MDGWSSYGFGRASVFVLLVTAAVAIGSRQRRAIKQFSSKVDHATRRRMKVVGHRGASHVAPENTVYSVRQALKSGFGFEVDLQRSKDGAVIVLHDETLWRTAADHSSWTWLLPIWSAKEVMLNAPVETLSLKALQGVTVGDLRHSEPVPLFSQILGEITHPPPLDKSCRDEERFVHCFAELKADGGFVKAGFDELLVEHAAKAVQDASIRPDQLTWISFSLGALQEMKRRLPTFRTLLVAHVHSSAEAWQVAQQADEAGMDGIDLNADPAVLSRELVEWMHSRGKLVAVWVFRAPASNDNEEVWDALAEAGVDFLTSNLPPAVRRWRDAEA